MEQSIISCDSKQHIRHGRSGRFRGLIGVTLVARKPSEFREYYDKILGNFFKGAKLPRKKKIYKSSEIGSLFPGRRERIMKAYRQLARSFIKIPNVEINVYYLTLDLEELRARIAREDPKKTTELEKQGADAELITIYGEIGREGAKRSLLMISLQKLKSISLLCAHGNFVHF